MRRLLLVGLGPLVGLGGFVAGVATTAADQPDRLATHWSLSGTPDGSFPFVGFVLVVAAAGVGAWLLLLAQLRRNRARELTVAPLAWGLMWFAVAVGGVVLGANAGAASWRDADSVGLPVALLPLLAGALGATSAMLLERDRIPKGRGGRDAVASSLTPATVGLAPNERALWSGRARSRVNRGGALLAAAAFGVAAFAVAGREGVILGVLGIVVVASILLVSEAEVTVDARGLTVGLGPFGFPRRHVPLSAIREVEHLTVEPLEWGGWGYRKVPRRRGATAIVMQRGDGLRVVADDGRDLVVTVPDASTAAALLSDLVRRQDGLVTA